MSRLETSAKRHRVGTVYACDARNYGADKRLCPLHMAAEDMASMLRYAVEQIVPKASGALSLDDLGWRDAVQQLLKEVAR